MEQILIYKPNGDNEPLNCHDPVSVITQAEHKKALLGDDVITITVESATVRSYGIGDYIQVFGMPKYVLNQLPKVSKQGERKYIYELVFEGLQYDLRRVSYRNTDVTEVGMSSDFNLTGDLEMFLNVLINNLNRVFGEDSWVLGDFLEGTETKNLAFTNENCLSVLQRLCEEYSQEFVFTRVSDQNVLHVRTTGAELEYNFKYGQGKGLYNLTRENVDTKDIVNTLWAYGSSKNLPADYKGYSPRLKLGIGDLPTLEAESIEQYGVFEASVIFEDIYPRRTGTVSGIDTGNRMKFTDSAMFDLNAKTGENTLYLIPGNTAKVRFQTGNLAGYEFEVSSYDHDDKTFTLNSKKDEKGLEMPSPDESAFQIQTGDTYILVDIVMPGVYIEDAEDELAAKAEEYLENHSTPKLRYGLELDELYVRNTAESENVFEIGDTVNIEDEALGIDTRIKITEFARDLLRPYKYTLTIQDTPQVSVLKRILFHDRKYNDVLKKRKLEDNFRPPVDWKSTSVLFEDIVDRLKKVKDIVIGAEDGNVKIRGDVELGGDDSFTKVTGGFGLVNGDGFTGNFSVADITGDFTYVLPDQDIEVNVWSSLIGVPELVEASNLADFFFIQDTVTGLQNGINTVFQVAQNFIPGTTKVFLNGIRQYRGSDKHYTESGPNEITFSEPPFADEDIIIDYIKMT